MIEDLECDVKCMRKLAVDLTENKYCKISFLVLLFVFLLTCLLWDPKKNIVLSSIVEKI